MDTYMVPNSSDRWDTVRGPRRSKAKQLRSKSRALQSAWKHQNKFGALAEDSDNPSEAEEDYPTPTTPATANPAPANPASTSPAPTNPAPTDPVPANPAPTSPTPADPTPADHTPTTPAASRPRDIKDHGARIDNKNDKWEPHTCGSPIEITTPGYRGII